MRTSKWETVIASALNSLTTESRNWFTRKEILAALKTMDAGKVGIRESNVQIFAVAQMANVMTKKGYLRREMRKPVHGHKTLYYQLSARGREFFGQVPAAVETVAVEPVAAS